MRSTFGLKSHSGGCKGLEGCTPVSSNRLGSPRALATAKTLKRPYSPHFCSPFPTGEGDYIIIWLVHGDPAVRKLNSQEAMHSEQLPWALDGPPGTGMPFTLAKFMMKIKQMPYTSISAKRMRPKNVFSLSLLGFRSSLEMDHRAREWNFTIDNHTLALEGRKFLHILFQQGSVRVLVLRGMWLDGTCLLFLLDVSGKEDN